MKSKSPYYQDNTGLSSNNPPVIKLIPTKGKKTLIKCLLKPPVRLLGR